MVESSRHWWPHIDDLAGALARVEARPGIAAQWRALIGVARHDLDYAATQRVDRFARRVVAPRLAEAGATIPVVRVALLSASTTSHLVAGLRVAGLSRGFWIEAYQPEYGQIERELIDPASGLRTFQPQVVVFLLPAESLIATGGDDLSGADRVAEKCAELRALWGRAKADFGADAIQQIPHNTFAPALGENERRAPGSPREQMRRLADALRDAALQDGVDIVDCDYWAGRVGHDVWRDQGLWHRAKQDVAPAAAPLFGDVLARVIGARRGRSAKCLALDLDNTLWGGVIGDDGLAGIVLGQGSPVGEAHLALQRHAKLLSRRGVLLAVCSKNDEAVARAAFDQHPDMALRADDISCFIANWNDKAANLREIAARLNIGLDAIVFADDNPFERNLAREAAPEVATLELGDDPSRYVAAIADSGLFEMAALTDADLARAAMYRDNASREAEARQATDMDAYLAGLGMVLRAGPFDDISLPRVTQLANKTNQFNLTTRRFSESEMRAARDDANCATLQARLIDKYGDNGIVAVLIGRMDARENALRIETWLMSCRVLGRGVEDACLNLMAADGKARGARWLVGEFRPSGRNEMTRDMYARLGFTRVSETPEAITWRLDLAGFAPRATHMAIGTPE